MCGIVRLTLHTGRNDVYDDGMATPDDAPLDKLPLCPVCGGDLVVAHDQSKMKVCVGRACGTSVTIPDDAWLKARMQGRKSQ